MMLALEQGSCDQCNEGERVVHFGIHGSVLKYLLNMFEGLCECRKAPECKYNFLYFSKFRMV